MIKELIKLSDGLAIYFKKHEVEKFGMIAGDKIDLSDMFLIESRSEKIDDTYQKLPKQSNKKMLKEIKREVRK